MNEGPLGVHEVELVVQSSPGLGNGSGVGEHAHGPSHLSKITPWYNGRGLIVDSDLESSRAPVNKLNAPLGLDGGDGSVDVLGNNVTPVEKAASHVLAMPGIAFNHLVGGLETGIGDLSHSQLLMVGLLGGDDRRIGHQREVNPGVGNQVGLELCQIHVQCAIKPQGSSDGGHNLTNQTIQVGIRRSLNVQIATTDVVDSFIVYHEGAVRVFQGGMGGKDGIVRLYHGSGDLGSRVDRELQLGLLSIVDRQSLHEEGSESRAGASAERVEEKESLEASAHIGQLPDPVQDKVDHLLADGVVAPGVVVGGVLFAVDELFRVEQLAVSSTSCLVDHRGFQVNEDGSGHMLSASGLREESGKGVVPEGLVGRHMTVRLDSMLKAVELPAGVTNLATSLANMNRDAFTLKKNKKIPLILQIEFLKCNSGI